MKKSPPSLINTAAPGPNLLHVAEQRIEGQILPKMRIQYQKIVVAGMKIGLENGTNGILYKLKDSKDPIGDCAKGAVGLVLLMRKQSRGTMPLPAMVPAAMTLMLKALDFARRSKIIPIVDEKVLVEATHIFTDTLFHAFNINAKMLQSAAKNIHGITQDPIRMRKVEEAAGSRKVDPIAGAQMAGQPQGSPGGMPQ